MGHRTRIALVAHDNCKHDLLDWARFNRDLLGDHELYATGTTGRLLEEELQLPVVRFLSGPLGGDQQIGSHITDGRINFSFSSGIPWSRTHTIPMSRLCSASRWSGTFRSPAIGRPPIS
jgi:methylglyoxal synthase